MLGIAYHFRRALCGAWGRKVSGTLTLGSIALAFTLLGGVFLVAQNLSHLTDEWGSGATVAVDLEYRVPSADAARVAQAIRETPGVREVARIKPAQAKARLMRRLGPEAEVIAQVEPSYLPASFEVTLGGERATVKAAQRRLARMAGVVPGVEAVRTVETWFHRLERLIHGVRLAGGILALLVLAACVYIIMVTVRLQFVDRREELQVMRLMGATARFIRTPYLLEGMGYGALGAVVAGGLLYGGFHLVSARASAMFGASVRGDQLAFLPLAHLAVGLGIGLLCGLLGAALATRSREAHV